MPHIHDLYDFTVSAFILHPTEPRICLHLHKKLNSWLQPGGHIELNEDPQEALERELQEETGLSKTDFEFVTNPEQPRPRDTKTITLPMHLDVHSFDETHKHIDFTYLIRAKTAELKPQDGESTEISWFDIKEIRRLHKEGIVYRNILDICEWIFKNIDKL
ncbi:NUDIX domain-containing protein [Candidatus Saccharibacteria bacterium]|nr:NUDIX domain-containing protein [Candidatus Saccharibacteria bacterium]